MQRRSKLTTNIFQQHVFDKRNETTVRDMRTGIAAGQTVQQLDSECSGG